MRGHLQQRGDEAWRLNVDVDVDVGRSPEVRTFPGARAYLRPALGERKLASIRPMGLDQLCSTLHAGVERGDISLGRVGGRARSAWPEGAHIDVTRRCRAGRVEWSDRCGFATKFAYRAG